MEILPLVIAFAIFPLSVAASRRLFGARHRSTALAAINLVGLLPLVVLAGQRGGVGLAELTHYLTIVATCYVAYVAIVVVAFVLTRHLARGAGPRPWVAFGFPIAAMLVVKYVPA
ncbi:MAG: hypothetical protein ACRELB_13685, partial [Polyangiaceae bacterium]